MGTTCGTSLRLHRTPNSCRMRHGRTKTHGKIQVLGAGAAVAAGGDYRGRGTAHGLSGGDDEAVLARGVVGGRSMRRPACARLPEAGPIGLSGSRPGGVVGARRRLGGGPPRCAAPRRSGAPGLSSGMGGDAAAHVAAPPPGIRPVVTATGEPEVSRSVPSLVLMPLAETSATGRIPPAGGRTAVSTPAGVGPAAEQGERIREAMRRDQGGELEYRQAHEAVA